jgi:hypothetical protein
VRQGGLLEIVRLWMLRKQHSYIVMYDASGGIIPDCWRSVLPAASKTGWTSPGI